MMPPDRPLRPLRSARPPGAWLQLAFALVAAPVTLAGGLTLLAFLIAGSTEADEAGTLAVTRHAGAVFLLGLSAFSLTFGLAGAVLLGRLGRRRLRDWLAAGAGSGVLVALGTGLARGAVEPAHVAVAVALGTALFALLRWYAGVRGG